MASSVPADTFAELNEATDEPRHKPTLLVVDDDNGPRYSIQVIFKDDFEVLMAADGPTAIELAQQNRIDVAVLDIRMPGMSGLEVLERLRYVDSSIEAVMMTGYETTDTMRHALQLRACDYINKPFDLSTMRAAVASALQRRTLEGELHDNEQRLTDLRKELHSQKIQEQAAQTRGEIYASILHDINGPLTVISGYMQMVNERIGKTNQLDAMDIQFVKDRLKTITRQVTNCIEISRRYLGFLRGHGDTAARVSVNQLFTDLEHLVRVHPSRQNHQFTIHPLAEDIAARMNGTDVIQVLLNLTTNAFQAGTQPHSVDIEGRVLHVPLDLTTLRDGPQVRLFNIENFENLAPLVHLSVRDTGPGIPPEILPKIFQAYFTTKGARHGTGLGLNIVQRLVKEARGALHVRTEVGQGTTFSIYLPAVAMAAAQPSLSAQAPRATAG